VTSALIQSWCPNPMNNPDSPRETWREFEQEMQDWVIDLWIHAKEEGELTEGEMDRMSAWTEDRYLNGTNAREIEDEYFIFTQTGLYE
jgi:hypothetical protein